MQANAGHRLAQVLADLLLVDAGQPEMQRSAKCGRAPILEASRDWRRKYLRPAAGKSEGDLTVGLADERGIRRQNRKALLVHLRGRRQTPPIFRRGAVGGDHQRGGVAVDPGLARSVIGDRRSVDAPRPPPGTGIPERESANRPRTDCRERIAEARVGGKEPAVPEHYPCRHAWQRQDNSPRGNRLDRTRDLEGQSESWAESWAKPWAEFRASGIEVDPRQTMAEMNVTASVLKSAGEAPRQALVSVRQAVNLALAGEVSDQPSQSVNGAGWVAREIFRTGESLEEIEVLGIEQAG
jgi:hypothetical protein